MRRYKEYHAAVAQPSFLMRHYIEKGEPIIIVPHSSWENIRETVRTDIKNQEDEKDEDVGYWTMVLFLINPINWILAIKELVEEKINKRKFRNYQLVKGRDYDDNLVLIMVHRKKIKRVMNNIIYPDFVKTVGTVTD